MYPNIKNAIADAETSLADLRAVAKKYPHARREIVDENEIWYCAEVRPVDYEIRTIGSTPIVVPFDQVGKVRVYGTVRYLYAGTVGAMLNRDERVRQFIEKKLKKLKKP